MKKTFSFREIIQSVITGSIAGLVAGLLVNGCWANMNAIKLDKVFLGTQYAYEYANYKNSTQEDNFKIIDCSKNSDSQQ